MALVKRHKTMNCENRLMVVLMLIPKEFGGVSHPRNLVTTRREVADLVETLPLVAKMKAMKNLIGQESFEKARLFCKAVGDHTKAGLSEDAAIAKVVDADPW